MKGIFFGGSGKLGTRFLAGATDWLFPSSDKVNITDFTSVYIYLSEHQPSVVIHAAAISGLKEAEFSREKTYLTNVVGTANIAKACASLGIRLVYISSVAVFDGADGFYDETAIPNPAYYYGWTKLLGEVSVQMVANHAIIRTDFYDPQRIKYPQAYIDHFSSKMHVKDLVFALKKIALSQFVGVLHVGAQRETLYAILKRVDPTIKGITIEGSTMPDFPRDLSLNTSLYQTVFGET